MLSGLLLAVAIPFGAVCIASIAVVKENSSLLDRERYWFENTGSAPREPFATLSNIVSIISATWLTADAPPSRFVACGIIAYAITLVGATSFLFHFDGARLRTSFHFGDVVSIITFGFLLSAISLIELIRTVAVQRMKDAIQLLQFLLPLSAAFAAYNLFPGWKVERATLYSHGLFVVLGIVCGMLKRNVISLGCSSSSRKLNRKALLLLLLDYTAPLVAIGTAYKLNVETWKIRKDANAIHTPNSTCTPNGYEVSRPYLGGCCDGLVTRAEATPDSHYKNCGGDEVVYGCEQNILVCRDPNNDEMSYEQQFFIRKFYETYDISHGVWHLLSSIFLTRYASLILSENSDNDVEEKLVSFASLGLFCAVSYPTCLTYSVTYDEKIIILLFETIVFFAAPFSFVVLYRRRRRICGKTCLPRP